MTQALSWQEVAERISVDRRTLYRIARTDPAFARIIYTVGRSKRVDQADLEAWIESKKRAAA